MISTGFPSNTSVLSEVVDLADESITCDALGDFPVQVAAASGGLINNSLPLICGGWNGSYSSECYIAGRANSDPLVKLLTPRGSSAALAMNSHQLWVTGGYNSVWPNTLASTEIVDVLVSPPTVVPGPQLKVPMFGHCIVQLNQSTAMFIGGDPFHKKTFFFNFATQSWTDGPDMNYGRYYFGCGMMAMGIYSSIIVVAGGAHSLSTAPATANSSSTSEFLNLEDPNGLKWSAGKN